MIAGLLLTAWQWSGLARTERFRRALDDPAGTQHRLLRSLVRRHAGSRFGQRHGFSGCTSPEDFRERVPLGDWAGAARDVADIQRGAEGILTVDPVQRLVPTSGSGAACKLIPWTRGLQEGFAAALAPWIDDVFRRWPAARGGPAYWSITPPVPRAPDPSVVPVGFEADSAYLGGCWRHLVARAMAVPDQVVTAPDVLWMTSLHLLRCADLRLISVWHPSMLELLFDRMARDRGALMQAVAEGTGHPSTAPAPGRARVLERCDWSDPRSLWPRLAVVSAWADGPAAIPARALAGRLRGIPFQPKGLLATEGVVTIPWHGRHPLALTSQVFEFLDDQGRCRWAHELAAGGIYEVILTNGGGLWRYRLGDLVQVTGHIGAAPCLKFLGRAGTVHDLAGEKLDEAFAVQVLTRLRLECAFAVLQPEPAHRRWRLLLDCRAVVPVDLPDRLDEVLGHAHHWRLARSLGQLAPPVVVALPYEASEILIRIAGHRRQRLGDCKPPVLLPADIDLCQAAPWTAQG